MNNADVNMRVLQASLLQSKKKVSGEISKEPFLDILLTDLEQSSFSLIFKNKAFENKRAPQKQITLTRLKTSRYLFSKSSNAKQMSCKKRSLYKNFILATRTLPSQNLVLGMRSFVTPKLRFVFSCKKLRFLQLIRISKTKFFARQSKALARDGNTSHFQNEALGRQRTKKNETPFKNLTGTQMPATFKILSIFNTSTKPCLIKPFFLEPALDFSIKRNKKDKNAQELRAITNQGLVKEGVHQELESKRNREISCLVKVGDYIHCGDKIGHFSETPIVMSESGKILRISQTQITIQKIQPVLFYSQAETHVESDEWVKRGTPILTLTHQTLVTGDIVQGIPRIEQLFEASTAAPPGTALQDFGSPSDDDSSKKSSIDDYLRSHHTSHLLPPTSSFIGAHNRNVLEHNSGKRREASANTVQNRQNNDQISDNNGEKRYDSTIHSTEDQPMFLYKTLQSQVRETFRKKWDQLPLPVAVRQSLEEIQQTIVESIQKVYISQGVLIADKHIEIIVRQMTSKAQVFDGGSTGLLIDEILSLQQIENANISTPGQKALYLPVIMGLTRAALSSDSFVSAASFQETTRVLSRDAVAGKTDFLRGLKEKVIIGDLIDAGTGLDAFYIYSLFSKKIFENKFREILNRKVTHKTLKKLVLTVAVPQQK